MRFSPILSASLLSTFLLTGCQHLDKLSNKTASDSNITSTDKSNDKFSHFIAAEIENEKELDEIDVALSQNYQIDDRDKSENEAVFGDVWRRIQAQLSFHIPENRRLTIQRDWYLKHPESLNRIAKRAEPFLYLIVEEIEKRNLPIELALLPIVESAFDPFAYSHSAASGLWQFVPATGKHYGLKQNWWYDGRRDVSEATRAALDYLQALNKMFKGNWLHALAAYNSGEGRVLRAIKKNYKAGENIDFWSLPLPRETDAYVPKLLALADIIKRPEHYNIKIRPIANVEVLEKVSAPSQIDLALVAKISDMNVNELHALNPGYNRWATAPKGPHDFLLPLDKADKFKQEVANLPSEKLLTWSRYKIKSGDNLGKIAKEHNISVEAIQKANKLAGNAIRAGHHLMIPGAASSDSNYQFDLPQRTQSKRKKKIKKPQLKRLSYKIKPGDTFWDISREFKVNIRSLAKWNKMTPSDPIFPGKSLTIWKKVNASSSSKSATTRQVRYKVRSGDSLSRIAQRFSVKVKDIESWNKRKLKKYLQPGQTLKLYVDVTNI